jgi:hypothetical protein
VVGAASSGSTKGPGFLWVSGQLYNLNNLLVGATGYNVNGAFAINAGGEIAGTATFGGQTHDVVLVPVPEPSSIALVTVGALASAIYFVRRMRR